jgi:hypothetical protein
MLVQCRGIIDAGPFGIFSFGDKGSEQVSIRKLPLSIFLPWVVQVKQRNPLKDCLDYVVLTYFR